MRKSSLEGASALAQAAQASSEETKTEIVGMRGIAQAGPMALERLDFYEHMEKSLLQQISEAKVNLIQSSEVANR
jgi:hypothetical protein